MNSCCTRQGAKKIIFTACHLGKLERASINFTSPYVISTSPKNFLTSRIDFTVLLLFKFLKNITCLLGKLKTEFTSPIVKSTSPGLSDTTFFAHLPGQNPQLLMALSHRWIKGLVSEDKRRRSRISPHNKKTFSLSPCCCSS